MAEGYQTRPVGGGHASVANVLARQTAGDSSANASDANDRPFVTTDVSRRS